MEIRQIFLDKMSLSELSDKPEELAAAARGTTCAKSFCAFRWQFWRRELRNCGYGFGLRGGIGRERADVYFPSSRVDQSRGY